MATNRIKAVHDDKFSNTLQLLYDDGTRGKIEYESLIDDEAGVAYVTPDALIGLTLKQAKMRLGVKE